MDNWVAKLARLSAKPNAVLGLALLGVAVIALLARVSVPERKVHEDWTILRPPAEVYALAIQGETVWAGGRDGLVAVDRRTLQVGPPPGAPPPFQYVRGLLVDRENRLWVAHQGGVARWSGSGWATLSESDGLLPGPATALWQDREGAVWVGAETGVVRLSEGAARAFTTREGLAAPTVNVIFQDREGVMWFGSADATRGGLTSFDGTRWRKYYTQDGLVHNSVNAIVQDRAGALWFACGFYDRGGASRLEGGVWTNLTRQDGLAGEKVRTIFEDREGRMWFASENDGIAVFAGKTRILLTPADGLSAWEVKTIVQEEDGVFWLGTLDGLTRIPSLD